MFIYQRPGNALKSETINNCFRHAKWKVSATTQEEVLESNELIFQEFYDISSLINPLEADDSILDEINRTDVTNIGIFVNDESDESNDYTLDETQIGTKVECVAALQKMKDYFSKKTV